jgi:hypothetical protein
MPWQIQNMLRKVVGQPVIGAASAPAGGSTLAAVDAEVHGHLTSDRLRVVAELGR